MTGISAQDFISLDPAADVLTGQALSGFAFTSFFAPGNATFFEFGALGESNTGSVVGPSVRTQPVPETTGGIVLLSIGFVIGIHRVLSPRALNLQRKKINKSGFRQN